MMHMWMWSGYKLGEFLFQGLTVASKGAFAGTWLVLFVVAFLFEGSKVFVAKAQREAARKLYPHKRSDERRNLLWETPPATATAGPSQNTGQAQVVLSSKYRILINLHQTVLYLLHNCVGYLLMLAVMIYNVYLILAVVLGMMLGYFVFGPLLTKLQMECFVNKGPHCTTECDDNAETTTPPLLHTSLSSESEFFMCQTPSCAQPSQYFTATGVHENDEPSTTQQCYYGAKSCPSKVAVAKRRLNAAGPSHCHQDVESDKDADSHNVEDAQLLQTERKGCCKKNTLTEVVTLDPVVRIVNPESCCSKKQKSSQIESDSQSHLVTSVEVTADGCCKNEGPDAPSEEKREGSPQILCCHKSSPSGSQENMI